MHNHRHEDRFPPLSKKTNRYEIGLEEALSVTERADVARRELFDRRLARKRLLHHLACESARGETHDGNRRYTGAGACM